MGNFLSIYERRIVFRGQNGVPNGAQSSRKIAAVFAAAEVATHRCYIDRWPAAECTRVIIFTH